MALETKEVRIDVPLDLHAILKVLATEADTSMVDLAKEMVCTILYRQKLRTLNINSAFDGLGLQSEVTDRRGFSEKKRGWE